MEYGKLTQRFLMSLRPDCYLVSSLGDEEGFPILVEAVSEYGKARREQWRRIKGLWADQRNCCVLDTREELLEWWKSSVFPASRAGRALRLGWQGNSGAGVAAEIDGILLTHGSRLNYKDQSH